MGVHWPPPPPPQPAKNVPLRNVQKRKFRPDMPAKKNVHVALRYDKIKMKKVGKKEDISKRRGIKLKNFKER